MEGRRNLAPIKLEMLFAIVHNNKAAYYSSLIQSHQANFQMVMPAQGTTHLILNYLGLADRPKSLIMSIVRADEAPKLIERLDEEFKKGKDYKGIAYTIKLTSIIGTLTYGFLSNNKKMKKEI